MATYAELADLFSINEPTGLRRKVAIAVLIAADLIREETEDATSAVVQSRKRYSQQILKNILNESYFHRGDDSPYAFHPVFESIYRSIIITNRGLTVAQITGASDTAIQTAVNTAVDHLAKSYPDPVPTP